MRRPRGGLAACLIAAILLSGGLIGSSGARADEPLVLASGRLSEAEWSFLRTFIIQRYAGGNANGFADVFRGWKGFTTRREAWSYIRNERLFAGHHDLDGEGNEELIVHIWLACGNVGCDTYVFSRRTGTWREMTVVNAGSERDHCIVKLHPGDPPILRTYSSAIWWTGGEAWACLYDCSPEEAARHADLRATLAERICSESK